MYLKIIIILMLFSFSALAGEFTDDAETVAPYRLTGQDLLIACSSSSLTHTGRRRKNYCQGFISGVEEGIRFYTFKQLVSKQPPFCAPPDITSRQLARAYIKYAAKKKTGLDKPAAEVVLEALKNTFPC